MQFKKRRGMSKRIAVVDDDIGTSLFFKICLEDEGYVVDTFNDPHILLEQFESGACSLLISDIRMPRISGFELVGRIKKMDSRIGICLSTAFEEYYYSIIKSYKDLDFICLIKKPTLKDELLKIVKDKFKDIEKLTA